MVNRRNARGKFRQNNYISLGLKSLFVIHFYFPFSNVFSTYAFETIADLDYFSMKNIFIYRTYLEGAAIFYTQSQSVRYLFADLFLKRID